jgi:dolichol-phosphate mannosyltransferase
VIPTYNEVANISSVVRAARAAQPLAHVLIVDDNSPDETGAVVDSLATSDPRVRVMHRRRKVGIGSAYVDAFRWGLREGYQTFIQMDADFSHDPSDIPRLIGALESGADVVLGSRNVPGGGVRGWGLTRHALSKGGSAYARQILGAQIRDFTTGFKAYTRAALIAIDVESVRSNGYAFQIETTYRAIRRGLTVCEIPIIFVDRRAGQSKMSGREIVEAIAGVWQLRWRARESSEAS